MADWIRAGDEPHLFGAEPKATKRRWNGSKAFLITLTLTTLVAALGYKDILMRWEALPPSNFAAEMFGQVLALPIIIVAIVAIRNLIACGRQRA